LYYSAISNTTVRITSRAKGKANYKVETLIQVVEEKLPNGAQGWIEVAALYQYASGELVLCDHEDVKRHWIEKCCHKLKKPTGTPGDPKRDMILRCQWIQERIHAKSASLIMGVESGGDDGLSIEEEEELASSLCPDTIDKQWRGACLTRTCKAYLVGLLTLNLAKFRVSNPLNVNASLRCNGMANFIFL
jgi:hypothetical protein